MLNFVWFDRNKIFRNAIFLEKKIDFPMIWVGFATGSGSRSKTLPIRGVGTWGGPIVLSGSAVGGLIPVSFPLLLLLLLLPFLSFLLVGVQLFQLPGGLEISAESFLFLQL